MITTSFGEFFADEEGSAAGSSTGVRNIAKRRMIIVLFMMLHSPKGGLSQRTIRNQQAKG